MKSTSVAMRIIFGLLTVTVLLTRAEDDLPRWYIRTGMEICTLIEMDAVIQHPVSKEVRSPIPLDAEVVGGENVTECDEDVQTMTLAWSDQGYDWEISLRFEASDKSYALTNFSGVVSGDGYNRSWSYREYSYPSAPTSDSIQCDLLILLGGRFENIRWQPFAQKTENSFGPPNQCQILETSGGVKFLFFVILALTVVAALVISLFNNPNRK